MQNKTREELIFELTERKKELNCQNQLSEILGNAWLTPDEVYENAVEIIPPGWQFPEETGARLMVGNREFKTRNFRADAPQITRDILSNGAKTGSVTVSCSVKNLPPGRQIFLPEEEVLLVSLTTRLGMFIEMVQKTSELSRSEEKYRSLIDSSDSAIMMINHEGVFLYLNEIAARPYGQKPEEMTGLTVEGLFPPEQAESILGDIREVIKNNKGKVVETSADVAGVKRWFRTSVQPVRNESGKPVSVIMYATDITNAKLASEKVKASEQKYKALFQESPLGYLIVQDGIFVECNEESARLIKGKREDIIGHAPHEISPEYQPNGKTSLESVAEVISTTLEKGTHEFEWIHTRIDGTEFLAHIYTSLIQYEGKSSLFVTWQDISDRRKMEISLKESQERLSRIAEDSQTLIWETNATGIFTYVSPVVSDILGFSPDEVIGKMHFGDFIPEKSRPEAKRVFLNRERFMKIVFTAYRADKNMIWLEVTGSPVMDNQGNFSGFRGGINDITTRKLAEEELRKFRTISDNANYGNAIALFDGTLVYCNDYFARMHGWEIVDLVGNNLAMLHSGQQLEAVKAAIDLLSTQGEFDGLEIWRTRKDGSAFPSLMNAKVIMEDGQPQLMWATAIDITKMKESENALRESEERLNFAQKIARMGHWDLDLKTETVTWSKNYFELVERNEKETVPTQELFYEIVHPDDHKLLEKIQQDILQEKTPATCEIRLIMPDGRIKWVQNNIIPTFENGELVRLVGVNIDITDIKQAEAVILELNTNLEKKVAERTAELENFFSVALDLLCIADTSGNFLKVNPAWEKILGYTSAELMQKKFLEFVHPDDIQPTLDAMGLLSEQNPILNFINRYKTAYGDYKYIEWRSVPVGQLIYAAARDITDRLQYEEELKNARHEAEQANLAKSEFLSRMSHELRTPMNSILGFAQLLDMGHLEAGQRKGVGHIIKSGKHLLELINEVLDISRIEAGSVTLSLEPVELSGLIREMIDIVQPHANGRNIRLEIADTPYTGCFVKSDRQRLKQVLLNLISNAVKYNKIGGTVSIRVDTMPEKEAGQVPVRISVTDTGVGISEENLPKVFNPFERIGAEKSETEGTGLGLSVVKKLMDLMGGNLGVASTLGEGTTFWVEFMEVDSQHDSLQKVIDLAELEASKIPGKGSILYIEDNMSNVDLVAEIIDSARPGIKLITSINGKQTVEMAVQYKPNLILLDLDLPDIHGSEVLERILANKEIAGIPVVILSADAMPKQIEKLLRQGASDYLIKPIDIPHFLNLVDRYV